MLDTATGPRAISGEQPTINVASALNTIIEQNSSALKSLREQTYEIRSTDFIRQTEAILVAQTSLARGAYLLITSSAQSEQGYMRIFTEAFKEASKHAHNPEFVEAFNQSLAKIGGILPADQALVLANKLSDSNLRLIPKTPVITDPASALLSNINL